MGSHAVLKLEWLAYLKDKLVIPACRMNEVQLKCTESILACMIAYCSLVHLSG
jgi:hypothetical protein